MAHARQRLILSLLMKKLRFFPVLALQGARQTGKSFLVRDLLDHQKLSSKYLTFDQLSVRHDANRAPQTFLTEHAPQPQGTLILDEAQKVPDIFDAIKFEVDQNKIPGRFLLLGSTEFSKLSSIRESLTGRMGRLRLFPMTLMETLGPTEFQKGANRKHLLNYLQMGGMPGMCFVRDEEERQSLMQDWIDLTCLRDIHQFKTLRLDSEICYSIFQLTSTLEEPTQAAIAKALKVDGRKIGTHLKALCELFALYPLDPHPSGTGKTIFLPLDAGIAHFFGANLLRRLHIWLLIERFVKNSSTKEKRHRFYYYRSTGKRMIHLIEEFPDRSIQAFQLLDTERVLKTDIAMMESFLQKKSEKRQGAIYAPVAEKQKINQVSILPWEQILPVFEDQFLQV